jgi:hypothetical protein
MFDYFANPSRFMRIANRLLLPLVILSVITGSNRLYLGLFVAPADYQQGDTVRIIYIHVPSAWLALFGYVGLGLCGLFYVVWRHPLADIAARAIAPGWRGFCPFDAGYRRFMGETDVGRMVGLGCPPDLNVNPVLFLSWLYRLGQWV